MGDTGKEETSKRAGGETGEARDKREKAKRRKENGFAYLLHSSLLM
jgi:hypothetical protein